MHSIIHIMLYYVLLSYAVFAWIHKYLKIYFGKLRTSL